MSTNAKCVYWNRCENVNGRPILLTVTKYDYKTIDVLINYSSENTIYRKGVLLLAIVILNLISLMFDIINVKYSIAIFVTVLFTIYNVAFTIQQERILVVGSLGYQIEVHYAVRKIIRFIAWQHVKSIFINEVVSKQRVIFILAVLTKDTAKEASAIIPLFTETMPRLQFVEVIYQCIQNCQDRVLI